MYNFGKSPRYKKVWKKNRWLKEKCVVCGNLLSDNEYNICKVCRGELP